MTVNSSTQSSICSHQRRLVEEKMIRYSTVLYYSRILISQSSCVSQILILVRFSCGSDSHVSQILMLTKFSC